MDPLNSAFSSVDGVLFNHNQTTLVEYPGGKFGGYTIPNSVTKIEAGAFAGCFSLANITLGTGVTSIGDSAFLGCFGLTGITIPDSLTSIGESAFQGCNGLTSVYFQGNAPSVGGTYLFAGDKATIY